MIEVLVVFTIIGASVTLLGAMVTIVRSALGRAYRRGFEEAQRLVEQRVRAEIAAEVESLKKAAAEVEALKQAVAELQGQLAAAQSKRWRFWPAV